MFAHDQKVLAHEQQVLAHAQKRVLHAQKRSAYATVNCMNQHTVLCGSVRTFGARIKKNRENPKHLHMTACIGSVLLVALYFKGKTSGGVIERQEDCTTFHSGI